MTTLALFLKRASPVICTQSGDDNVATSTIHAARQVGRAACARDDVAARAADRLDTAGTVAAVATGPQPARPRAARACRSWRSSAGEIQGRAQGQGASQKAGAQSSRQARRTRAVARTEGERDRSRRSWRSEVWR